MEYTQKESLLIFFRTLRLSKQNGFSLNPPDPENPSLSYRDIAISQLESEGKIRTIS